MIALRHGVAAALLLSLLAFGPYGVPALRAQWLQAADAWLLAVAVPCMAATWLAMRAGHRRRPGTSGFGADLAVGMAVTLAAALVAGCACWLFYAAAGDALPEALYAAHLPQLDADASGPPAAARDIEALAAVRPMFFDRGLQAMLVAGTVLAIGVLQSLAGALLLRSRDSVR